MQHRLKQLIQPFAAGGLLGFHLADFCHPPGKLLLHRERWNGNGQALHIFLVDARLIDRVFGVDKNVTFGR